MPLTPELTQEPDRDAARRRKVRRERIAVVAVSLFCVGLMTTWSFFRLTVCWSSEGQTGWVSAACRLDSLVHLVLVLGLAFLMLMIFQLSRFGSELLARLDAFDEKQLRGLDRVAEQRFGTGRIARPPAGARLAATRLNMGVARQELGREGPGLGTWLAVAVCILIVAFLLFGPFDSLLWQS